jgi:hypothetical protein
MAAEIAARGQTRRSGESRNCSGASSRRSAALYDGSVDGSRFIVAQEGRRPSAASTANAGGELTGSGRALTVGAAYLLGTRRFSSSVQF